MTTRSPRAVCGLLALLAAAAGCRATATVSTEDGGDLGVGDLAAPEDLAGADFAFTPDLACSGPAVPEICGNGCDDDRNGYVDDDDSACTTQMLVALPGGSAALFRLQIEPAPRLLPLDGNPVGAGVFPTYRRGFSPRAYLAFDAASKTLRTLTLADGGTGTFSDFLTTFNTRDVCTFNGELIVVERNLPSNLHRFMADGRSEIAQVAIPGQLATACASDGNLLYVAVHDAVGNPSQFLVFDKTYAQIATIPIANSLQTAGLVHCIGLAWTKKAGVFYGLFTTDLNPNDTVLSADQVIPFSFDGAVGAPIDAGLYHGIGDFVP